MYLLKLFILPRTYKWHIFWRVRQDSNLQPSDLESDALAIRATDPCPSGLNLAEPQISFGLDADLTSELGLRKIRNGAPGLRRSSKPRGQQFSTNPSSAGFQTLTSLCTVWLLQLGQNFLIANFSVCRFLFLLVT